MTPPLDGDQILAAQTIVIGVTLWVLLAVVYLKGEIDRALCMEHNLTMGAMFYADLLTGKQVAQHIFCAIHDDKF